MTGSATKIHILLNASSSGLLSLRDKLIEHFPAHLSIPLTVPTGKCDNLPPGIDKKSDRYPTHSVLGCDLGSGVQHVQESQILVPYIIFYHPFHFILTPLVNANSEDDQVFTPVITVDLFKRGPLFPAIRSPGGPEVQHNKLSLKILQTPFFPQQIGKGKSRGVNLLFHPHHP